MYSMVLLAALTSGTATPDFGHRHGCCGCCGGCYGGCYGYGCCGGCYGGGYGCGGCYGGGYGGCYGGCWGGCYGCYGGCYGSVSCFGGCYGSWGCMGGSYGSPVMGGGYNPVILGGTGTGTGTGGEELKVKPKEDTNKKEASTSNRARLIVELPADAKLYIDDRAMKSTSEKRTFHTPALESGQAYYYILKAEVMRDGKPVTETRRVIVRAGDVIREKFDNLASEPLLTAKSR